MYAKSTRPSAKLEVQKERSAQRDDQNARWECASKAGRFSFFFFRKGEKCFIHRNSGAYPLLRHRGSIAASQCRNPQHDPLLRTSSSSCYGLASCNQPPCGQSQGSGNTFSPPFSYGLCRRRTRSWCGPPWAASAPLPPLEAHTPSVFLYRVSCLETPLSSAPVRDRRSFRRHPRRLPLQWLVPVRWSQPRSWG